MYERLVRIESKLSKLLLHVGLDENGFPRKESPQLTLMKGVK
jgi:hypothetical protein